MLCVGEFSDTVTNIQMRARLQKTLKFTEKNWIYMIGYEVAPDDRLT